jgi:hypothetical protein
MISNYYKLLLFSDDEIILMEFDGEHSKHEVCRGRAGLADLPLRCADDVQDTTCFVRAMLMGNKHNSRADHKLRDLNRRVSSVAEINRLEDRDSLVGRLKALVDHAPESSESLGIVHTES